MCMSRKSSKPKAKGGRAESTPKPPRPRRTFKHGLRQRIIWRDAKADYRARLRLAADMSAPAASEGAEDNPPDTSVSRNGLVVRQRPSRMSVPLSDRPHRTCPLATR
jgi:hypothetical protein